MDRFAPLRRPSTLAALLLFVASSAVADGRFDAFGELLAAFRTQNAIPALVAVVVEDGAIAWESAWGTADDEGEVPATPDTVFWIASVTKPLAATAILAEAAAGRLSPATPLSADPGWAETCEWLRGTRIPFGGGTTLEDGTVLPPVACDRELTIRDALDMKVNGPAGHGFVYNPIVYARLDRVIEGAGGRPLREIVRERVVDPAGMRDTALGWRDPDGGAALRLLAPPFALDEEGRPQKAPFPDDDFRAAAGVYTSARQLARFDIAFDSDALLPPEVRAEIVDAPEGYSSGWFHQTWDGHRLLWHSGWEPDAYSALYLKVPDEHLTLILLANTEGLWWGNSLVRAEVEKSPLAAAFLAAFVEPAGE
ncbi:MAG: serine hydrolase domain-containing protein [Thermoanaerobaculia bacterium]